MNTKINRLIAWGAMAAIAISFISIGLINIAASGTLGDAYFVSDSRKLVLSTIQEMPEELNTSYSPVVMHYVYFYHDEDITGSKVYLQFNSSDEANTVNNELVLEGEGDIIDKTTNGKYLVLSFDPETFNTATTTSIRSQIEEAKSFDDYAELINGTWTLVNNSEEAEE